MLCEYSYNNSNADELYKYLNIWNSISDEIIQRKYKFHETYENGIYNFETKSET